MDTWERRGVPVTLGYNNPAPNALVLQVTYEPCDGVVVLTANHPVFAAVDVINFETTGGDGSLAVGGAFIVDSPVQITFLAGVLPTPAALTQLDIYTPGPTLVGTWTGALPIVLLSFTTTYDSIADTLTVVSNYPDFMDDVDSIDYNTNDGTTQIDEGSGYTQPAGDTIVIAGASGYGEQAQQIDYYSSPAHDVLICTRLIDPTVPTVPTQTTTITSVVYDRPTNSVFVTLADPYAGNIDTVNVTLDPDPGLVTFFPGQFTVIDPSTISFPNQCVLDSDEVVAVDLLDIAPGQIAAWSGSTAVLSLGLTWDDITDTLLIVANHPMLLDDGGPTEYAMTLNGITALSNPVPIVVIDDASNAHLDGWGAFAGAQPPNPSTDWELTFFRLQDSSANFWGCWVGDINNLPPVVDQVQAPGGVGQISIFGQRFQSSVQGAVDKFTVEFDDTSTVDFYPSSSPNVGLNPPGTVSVSYTDSGIDFTNAAALSGKTISRVRVEDIGASYSIFYDVSDVVVP